MSLFCLLSSCSQNRFGKTCISIEKQTLRLQSEKGDKKKEYRISSSKFGEGFKFGSYKTPTGLFIIVDKIGANEKINTVFKGRKPVKKATGRDVITSRIIQLHGLETKNENTLKRCVYVHGTNREDLLGTKASYGCIRMGNKDIIDYFDNVEIGNIVEIK